MRVETGYHLAAGVPDAASSFLDIFSISSRSFRIISLKSSAVALAAISPRCGRMESTFARLSPTTAADDDAAGRFLLALALLLL